jgi:hypothetical protein
MAGDGSHFRFERHLVPAVVRDRLPSSAREARHIAPGPELMELMRSAGTEKVPSALLRDGLLCQALQAHLGHTTAGSSELPATSGTLSYISFSIVKSLDEGAKADLALAAADLAADSYGAFSLRDVMMQGWGNWENGRHSLRGSPEARLGAFFEIAAGR